MELRSRSAQEIPRVGTIKTLGVRVFEVLAKSLSENAPPQSLGTPIATLWNMLSAQETLSLFNEWAPETVPELESLSLEGTWTFVSSGSTETGTLDSSTFRWEGSTKDDETPCWGLVFPTRRNLFAVEIDWGKPSQTVHVEVMADAPKGEDEELARGSTSKWIRVATLTASQSVSATEESSKESGATSAGAPQQDDSDSASTSSESSGEEADPNFPDQKASLQERDASHSTPASASDASGDGLPSPASQSPTDELLHRLDGQLEIAGSMEKERCHLVSPAHPPPSVRPRIHQCGSFLRGQGQRIHCTPTAAHAVRIVFEKPHPSSPSQHNVALRNVRVLGQNTPSSASSSSSASSRTVLARLMHWCGRAALRADWSQSQERAIAFRALAALCELARVTGATAAVLLLTAILRTPARTALVSSTPMSTGRGEPAGEELDARHRFHSSLHALASMMWARRTAVGRLTAHFEEMPVENAGGASGPGWGTIVGITLDASGEIYPSSLTFSDGNMLARSSRGQGIAAVKTQPITEGTWEFEWVLEQDNDTSQCSCFGFIEPPLTHNNYSGEKVWFYRSFNGNAYSEGRESSHSGNGDKRIRTGDHVFLTLDMSTGTASIRIKDRDQGVVFRDLQGRTLYGAVQFYSSGPAARLVEVKGPLQGGQSMQASTTAGAEEALPGVSLVPVPSDFSRVDGDAIGEESGSGAVPDDSVRLDELPLQTEFVAVGRVGRNGMRGALCQLTGESDAVGVAAVEVRPGKDPDAKPVATTSALCLRCCDNVFLRQHLGNRRARGSSTWEELSEEDALVVDRLANAAAALTNGDELLTGDGGTCLDESRGDEDGALRAVVADRSQPWSIRVLAGARWRRHLQTDIVGVPALTSAAWTRLCRQARRQWAWDARGRPYAMTAMLLPRKMSHLEMKFGWDAEVVQPPEQASENPLLRGRWEVWGDDSLLWEWTGRLRAGHCRDAHVDVAGVTWLTLRVHCAQADIGVNGIFVDPTLYPARSWVCAGWRNSANATACPLWKVPRGTPVEARPYAGPPGGVEGPLTLEAVDLLLSTMLVAIESVTIDTARQMRLGKGCTGGAAQGEHGEAQEDDEEQYAIRFAHDESSNASAASPRAEVRRREADSARLRGAHISSQQDKPASRSLLETPFGPTFEPACLDVALHLLRNGDGSEGQRALWPLVWVSLRKAWASRAPLLPSERRALRAIGYAMNMPAARDDTLASLIAPHLAHLAPASAGTPSSAVPASAKSFVLEIEWAWASRLRLPWRQEWAAAQEADATDKEEPTPSDSLPGPAIDSVAVAMQLEAGMRGWRCVWRGWWPAQACLLVELPDNQAVEEVVGNGEETQEEGNEKGGQSGLLGRVLARMGVHDWEQRRGGSPALGIPFATMPTPDWDRMRFMPLLPNASVRLYHASEDREGSLLDRVVAALDRFAPSSQ